MKASTVTKNEQMDFGVRYWDENKQVVDHYLTSKLIGHATAKDLHRCFKEATEKMNPNKILQVSMDGPNINKKLFNNILDERKASDPTLPCLLELGTCGLYTIHGAFRTGF